MHPRAFKFVCANHGTGIVFATNMTKATDQWRDEANCRCRRNLVVMREPTLDKYTPHGIPVPEQFYLGLAVRCGSCQGIVKSHEPTLCYGGRQFCCADCRDTFYDRYPDGVRKNTLLARAQKFLERLEEELSSHMAGLEEDLKNVKKETDTQMRLQDMDFHLSQTVELELNGSDLIALRDLLGAIRGPAESSKERQPES